MGGAGVGVPGRRAGEIASGDLDAVEIGDKAVVVADSQGHKVEVVQAAIKGKWDADVTGGISSVHPVCEVKADELAITRNP